MISKAVTLIVALGCVGCFLLAALAPLTAGQLDAAIAGGIALTLPTFILGVLVLDA